MYIMEDITFYKISCKDDSISDVYIGSTKDFKNRISKHKYACNNKNSHCHNLKVYCFIRDNGGFDNWTIDKIETLICDKKQRDERERYWIEYYNASLNEQVPGRSMIEYSKLYREQHRDKINEKQKLYYEQHKDVINEKIECVCGVIVFKRNITRHKKTKKHIDRINNNI